MMIFAVVIPGVLLLAALSVMFRNEAKCLRRDDSATDPMFTGKRR